jgi:hypothetical protein
VRWSSILGLSPALLGCEGDDVSVGTESGAINSSRCYGSSSDGDSAPESISLEGPELASCSEEPVGKFTLGYLCLVPDESTVAAASTSSTKTTRTISPTLSSQGPWEGRRRRVLVATLAAPNALTLACRTAGDFALSASYPG